MAGAQLCLWSLGQSTLISDADAASFVFNDGRVVELKLVDPHQGHFVLNGWAQGDPDKPHRASAIGASFDVNRQRAQLGRLSTYQHADFERVVTTRPGPEMTCVIKGRERELGRHAGMSCVDFRLPDGGPVVQFGVNNTPVGGPGVFWVRGWPAPPADGEDEGGPLEYLGIYFTLRGAAAQITSAHGEEARVI